MQMTRQSLKCTYPGEINTLLRKVDLQSKKRNEYQGILHLTDKACEGDKTRNLAGNYGHEPVVPPKKNRSDPYEYDVELYKRRDIIESLFRWLKEFRKVFARYDKFDSGYLYFIYSKRHL